MAAKTDPINTSNPAGSSDPKQGDNYIRTLADALIELLAVDHYVGVANPWGSDASGDETGEHVKVTFHGSISDPTVASGDGVLYVKGDPPELHFRDEDDGNVIQLTSGGEILFSSLSSIANNTYFKAMNNAGTGTANLIKASTGDIPILANSAALVVATASAATKTDRTIADKGYVDDYADAAPKAQAKVDNVAGATFEAASESITVPNGLIMKTGSEARTGSSTPVSFGDNFPNAIVAVIVAGLHTSSTGSAAAVTDKAVSGFTIKSGTNLSGFDWIAIGY